MEILRFKEKSLAQSASWGVTELVFKSRSADLRGHVSPPRCFLEPTRPGSFGPIYQKHTCGCSSGWTATSVWTNSFTGHHGVLTAPHCPPPS